MPTQVFELGDTLEMLDVSRNALTEVPGEVGSALPRLERLYLSYNKIGPRLPFELMKLDRLRRLDLCVHPVSFVSDYFIFVTLPPPFSLPPKLMAGWSIPSAIMADLRSRLPPSFHPALTPRPSQPAPRPTTARSRQNNLVAPAMKDYNGKGRAQRALLEIGGVASHFAIMDLLCCFDWCGDLL